MTKVLIVEDDGTVRDTLALNLRAEGYMVFTAADGAMALELARSETPDLVVLDVMLPELDSLTHPGQGEPGADHPAHRARYRDG